MTNAPCDYSGLLGRAGPRSAVALSRHEVRGGVPIDPRVDIAGYEVHLVADVEEFRPLAELAVAGLRCSGSPSRSHRTAVRSVASNPMPGAGRRAPEPSVRAQK